MFEPISLTFPVGWETVPNLLRWLKEHQGMRRKKGSYYRTRKELKLWGIVAPEILTTCESRGHLAMDIDSGRGSARWQAGCMQV